MPFGNVLLHFDKLSSTNDFALKWLKYHHPAEGTLITTDYQYAGKGQQSAQWITQPRKNLTCTYILYPHFLSVSDIYLLNKAVCLAVVQTLESIIESRCFIKWPNDIYIDSSKVAGILIQNSIQGRQIAHSIIGIGLNVSQEDFPEGIKATSISKYLDHKIPLHEVRDKLNNQLSNNYEVLKEHAPGISEQYDRRLLGKNAFLRYKEVASGEQFEAKTIKVDSLGKLHLEVNNKIKVYAFKEIELNI